MPDPAARIDTLRGDRIPDNNDISEADRETLIDFSDELFLRKSEYSDYRHEKLLRHCVRMAEQVGGLAAAREDRDAAEDIVRWINKTYDNEETNRDYRVALRIFGKHTTKGDDQPPSIDWISGQTSRSYQPKPDPANMLHWDEHIQPMIDAANNNRDAAIIAVAWDAGCRSGEFRSLEVGDITDHKHGLQITVDGKTGQRTVTLIPSVPILTRWLQDHPARDDLSAPLWSKLHHPEGLSFRMFKKILETTAERAGVNQPVTLTNFRKSSASHLASRGMSQAHIEEHHGWTRGSNIASRYISVFADDADRELARIHGLDVEEDEPDPIAPVECPRCGRDTPRDQDFCVWCEQAIEPGAVEQLKIDERRVQRVILGFAKDDPSLLDDVEEREKLLTVLQDDPEAQRRAEQFLEEIGLSN
jgi:integrase